MNCYSQSFALAKSSEQTPPRGFLEKWSHELFDYEASSPLQDIPDHSLIQANKQQLPQQGSPSIYWLQALRLRQTVSEHFEFFLTCWLTPTLQANSQITNWYPILAQRHFVWPKKKLY